SFVIAEATMRYLRAQADDVTVVAMGNNGTAPSEKCDACARYLTERLAGRDVDMRPVFDGMWANEDPDWPEWFPRRDAELALQLDRFDFALPVTREDGLLVARPVR